MTKPPSVHVGGEDSLVSRSQMKQPVAAQHGPQARSAPSGLSGATVNLTAYHLDATMDEGWHEHTWAVTAWARFPPWRDTRTLREALSALLEAIAPYDGAIQARRLPPEMWTGEAIAAACMTLGNVEAVWVQRPGFWVRLPA